MEINGEATHGITHTRAIELIQAGGNKVHLLLRTGQGLVPDHSESQLKTMLSFTFSPLITLCNSHACVAISLTFSVFHTPNLFIFFAFSVSAHLSVSTFLFSCSCRSELFFHTMLLHETRASIKASLLFLVCL